MTPELRRTILRDDVRRWVLDAICRGSLAPGAALGEVELARELGISRTPLREALVALERDGFVVSRPGRGFTVARLVAAEMGELYPLIGALEALALRASPCPAPKELDALRRLNDKLGSARSLERSLTLDEQWHERVLAASTNRRALAVLAREKAQVRRFEFAFSRIVDDVETSMGEHAAVLDALEGGDVELAARRLEDHWQD